MKEPVYSYTCHFIIHSFNGFLCAILCKRFYCHIIYQSCTSLTT